MKKSYPILYLTFLIFCSSFALAQVNYNDVAVIVNQNDSVSIAIGNYFMQKRNIPSINKILVDVPAVEEVNDSIFTAMRHQVENYITSHSLLTSLNYLVTTKGCPLKVMRFANDTNNCNASVESELMLILGSHSSTIGNCLVNGQQVNPYYQSTLNFSRALYQIFLVTRLDAYTVQDVFGIIDRGGPNRFVSRSSSLFVFDQDPNFSTDPLNAELVSVTPILTGRGWQVLLDTDTVFVTDQSNVLGYHSWGSNDSHNTIYSINAKPRNSWLPGSLAETNVSTSARSFQPSTPYGQSLIADLITEGVTCVKGYVYEPGTIAIAQPFILWNRYTNLNALGHPRYNMAESFFSASQMISWKDVVIGDPKTSITTDSAYYIATNTFAKEVTIISPNPADEEIRIKNGERIEKIEIYNIVGIELYNYEPETKGDQQEVIINVTTLKPGIYFLCLTNHKERRMIKFIKE